MNTLQLLYLFALVVITLMVGITIFVMWKNKRHERGVRIVLTIAFAVTVVVIALFLVPRMLGQ